MNSDTLNRHTYCINNPICYADPSGLRYMDALMIADGGGKKTKANQIANTPSVETQLKQLKEKAKKASVKKIDSVTTRNSYEYYIHSNYAPNNILYEKVPQNRKNAENKLFEFARRIPDSKSVINMQCATYVYDAYYSTKTGAKTIIGSYLFNAIPALGRRATSSYTVPQYAAFAGEYAYAPERQRSRERTGCNLVHRPVVPFAADVRTKYRPPFPRRRQGQRNGKRIALPLQKIVAAFRCLFHLSVAQSNFPQAISLSYRTPLWLPGGSRTVRPSLRCAVHAVPGGTVTSRPPSFVQATAIMP